MRGRQLPKWDYFCNCFAENCIKMKEFGPRGGAHPWRPLDLPMQIMLKMFCSSQLAIALASVTVSLISTTCQRSWGKVLFSLACVCPQGVGMSGLRSLPGVGWVCLV